MSSNFQWIQPGDKIKLVFFSDDGDNTLYPRATVYDSSNVLVDTIDLSVHASIDGLYTSDFTPPTAGHYNILYIPYSDSGHTVIDLVHGKAHEPVLIRHMPASFTSGTTGLSKRDIEAVTGKVGKKVWEYEFMNGRIAEEELIVKSEFNAENETVKVDYDFQKSTNKVISIVSKASGGVLRAIGDIPGGIDYSKELKDLQKELKRVGKIDLSGVHSRVDGLIDVLNTTKQEILDKQKPIDLSVIDVINSNVKSLEENLTKAIGKIPSPKDFDYSKFENLKKELIKELPTPEEFDYSKVEKVGVDIKKEIKANKTNDNKEILTALGDKIDAVDKVKLLVSDLYNDINKQHDNLLTILDRLVGRLDQLEKNITTNQDEIANLISNASSR